jgi:hypothetical protein
MMNHNGRASKETGIDVDPARAFLDYFRCPQESAPFRLSGRPSAQESFFPFGSVRCFGRVTTGRAPDVAGEVVGSQNGTVSLFFNPTEVIENFRLERYVSNTAGDRWLRGLYYFLRPVLPLTFRRLLQRCVFRSRISSFPAWPADCSVEQIFKSLMELAIRAADGREIPFIWFWPKGRNCAATMTHDVEEENGAANCEMLMDLDESFGIRASFQLVPEGRYQGVEELITRIRERGFETNIHDLDHDGRLYEHVELFQQRARKINEYARKYGMKGFRAGAMHRNQEWFDMLDFQYDMSIPTVSHLEPQGGGCCTVTPYFVGKVLELPLTTVQDHGLFFILGERSIDLWRHQIEIISGHHGLISFIVHPDYIIRERERSIYSELLQYLSHLREERDIWFALPNEINRWWRERSEMQLIRERNRWQIRGTGCERAQLAYAGIIDGRLTYRFADGSSPGSGESTPARASVDVATDVRPRTC